MTNLVRQIYSIHFQWEANDDVSMSNQFQALILNTGNLLPLLA